MSTTLNYKSDPRTKILFALGTIAITPGANDEFLLSNENPTTYLKKHMTGDWGELDEHDRKANEASVRHGERIMSVYHLATNAKIYIITEWDRSVTTILLPEDY